MLGTCYIKQLYLRLIECVPKKRFKISYNRRVWLTQELIEIGRDRDIAARYARRKKHEAAFARARNIRNEYNRAIYSAKCDYIINQLERHKNDQKKFWESI